MARHSQLAEQLARLFCDLRLPEPRVLVEGTSGMAQHEVFGSLPEIPPAEPPQPRTASEAFEAQARRRRWRSWIRPD